MFIVQNLLKKHKHLERQSARRLCWNLLYVVRRRYIWVSPFGGSYSHRLTIADSESLSCRYTLDRAYRDRSFKK